MSVSAVLSTKKVIYMDLINSWYPDPTVDIRQAVDSGFNVIILAFYLSSGPADIAYAWSSVATEEQRKYTLDYIHNKGSILLVSAGGATESPYETISGAEYGTRVSEFAKEYGFDGVDFDLENFSPGLTYGSMTSEEIIDWLSDCTTACRNIIGADKYITHAPQAPYIGKIGDSTTWANVMGGYAGVNAKVGDIINFYNIQFYNQGESCYTTYDGLFIHSCSSFPGTSVLQIADTGIPLDKIVVGKPMLTSDASNGYVDPRTLGQWLVQAENDIFFHKNIMTWQWHDESTSQIWLSNLYPIDNNLVCTDDNITEIFAYNKNKSTKSKYRRYR